MTKFILTYEEDPIVVLSNEADAEEMWLAFYEENIVNHVNDYLNQSDGSLEWVFANWNTIKRVSNYGYWIKEVPYFD